MVTFVCFFTLNYQCTDICNQTSLSLNSGSNPHSEKLRRKDQLQELLLFEKIYLTGLELERLPKADKCAAIQLTEIIFGHLISRVVLKKIHPPTQTLKTYYVKIQR